MKMTLINIKSLPLKKYISMVLGASFLLFSNHVKAEPLSAQYKVYWGGMHVADLAATADYDRISTKIDTKGMVAMVSNYKNQAEATFHIQDGEYLPARFSKKSQKVTGQKHTEISYAANGRVNNFHSSEELSEETAIEAGKLRAVDPLSAYVIAREKVRAAIRSNTTSFSLPTYDGKKIARLDFEILGKKQKEISSKLENVYHIRMTRVPLIGFSNDENSNSVVELYVSTDEHLLPLLANAKAPLGHATIILEKRCYPADQCA